ncbi:hypothetical protein [Acidithiobacillus ferriphilus]|uniref:Uncharacterized protein n=1 Tax=Acidithiobacillus ferriphilus TaxID=1689834 RepID=A0ABU6FVM4_9PROT|nr:hypothetical protein [Acidithiobacillus ferriphilus]MDA8153805.1 hypothetical protein [Acidithiobacillus sp.]MEB8485688.1 hypothetical protein [Acidithiobacillus ferriphilus]MEB8490025.1 hypothetical protein [Acidithiobacillus ferriphilus]MEB8494210.1 hypothetical protein [Acidithiobacillus ferriphilus]MEB8515602.1 hypothetical protein [Acidithiobacillus ferriphilus]
MRPKDSDVVGVARRRGQCNVLLHQGKAKIRQIRTAALGHPPLTQMAQGIDKGPRLVRRRNACDDHFHQTAIRAVRIESPDMDQVRKL